MPWQKEISTFGFAKTANGSLVLDCGSDFKLPVWDEHGKLQQECSNQPADWLKKIFTW
ncbi:multimodular transpeptidase-transglycosylase [Vibrio ponticus]|nr:multimodular transpeptidase-transglycosylase [Vibrio ponticus]